MQAGYFAPWILCGWSLPPCPKLLLLPIPAICILIRVSLSGINKAWILARTVKLLRPFLTQDLPIAAHSPLRQKKMSQPGKASAKAMSADKLLDMPMPWRWGWSMIPCKPLKNNSQRYTSNLPNTGTCTLLMNGQGPEFMILSGGEAGFCLKSNFDL